METDRISDSDLVESAKNGELSAFEALVARHQRRVYTIARRITGQEQDAEDVTQQAFLDAMEHLGSFRAEASFATWISRIATHAAIKVLRKRRMKTSDDTAELAAPLPHPEFIADWHKGPAELAADHEAQQFIDEALLHLPENYRVVFVLRDIEGFSVMETAEQLGLTSANVKVRLLRARLLLREELTRKFGDRTSILEPHRHANEL